MKNRANHRSASKRLLAAPWAFLCLAAALPLRAHSVTPVRGEASTPSFQCSETIVVKVDWDPRPQFPMTLTAEWLNKASGLRHTTNINIEAGAPASYLWMKFDPPSGESFSRVLPGEEAVDRFVGPWSVEVFLNGSPSGTTDFEVRC